MKREKHFFSEKKYPEIFCRFGYYQYLCTRFPKNGRPPGPFGSVWEGVLWKISIRQRSSTRSGSPCLMHGDPGIWEQPSGGIFNAALLMFWCPLPSIDCTGYASLWQTDFFRVRPSGRSRILMIFYNGEFDPGSGWTLATGLTHASRGAAWRKLASFDGDRRTGE